MARRNLIQELQDEISARMKEDAVLVRSSSGAGYLRHTLRGYFNLNLLTKGDEIHRQIGTVPMGKACLDEFRRFVIAASAGEPTEAEIDSFSESIPDQNISRLVSWHLHECMRNIQKYRP